MKKTIFLALSFAALVSCSKTQAESENQGEQTEQAAVNLTTETILGDRGAIWGFKFLPNGDIIFTEREGKIGIFSNGKVTEIKGVPKVAFESQGGLLDIALHPDYANNGWIYTAYLENTPKKDAQLNLIRFKIENNEMKNIETLHTTSATNKWRGHNGSRIVFDNDGYLFWAVGEGGQTSRGGADSPNQNAQNVKESWGKIHRMTDDGKVPADNPILPGNPVATTLYSYGHRNPQGLVFNPKTNEIWETEHGPRGGDELNLIKAGLNYGWPLVSFGINYDSVDISGAKHEGFEAPKHYWTPSIGASGLAYLNSDVYGKNWNGNLFAGGLALTQVSRVYFENGEAKAETVLKDVGRVRTIEQGPDGYLYLSLEGPGRIVKVVPAK